MTKIGKQGFMSTATYRLLNGNWRRKLTEKTSQMRCSDVHLHILMLILWPKTNKHQDQEFEKQVSRSRLMSREPQQWPQPVYLLSVSSTATLGVYLTYTAVVLRGTTDFATR